VSARPGRKRFDGIDLGLGVWSVGVYIFLFLPIVFMVAHSFNDGGTLYLWGGFSTRWFVELWDNRALVASIRTSIQMAVGTTVISTVLGGLAGIALARKPGRWTAGFMALVFLVLVTPEIVDAIGLQIWFVRLGGIFRTGIWPLWIGVSIFSTAVTALIVRARMSGLDESLEEAAADLYAPPGRAFRQITLPLVAPGLLAGALLSFTFALDNTIVSQFVSLPGNTPYSVFVFSNAVKGTVRPYIGAASTLLLALTLFALLVVVLVLRRSGDSSSEIAGTITGTGS
jgi:ABC-type spermidine/putrescine transport system permease subunit II